MIITLLHWMNYAIFIYFIFVQSSYIILVLLSIPELISRYREARVDNIERIVKSESIPDISIFIPVYNMADSVGFMLNCFIALTYRKKRIILVNDGSTDGTMEYLINAYKLLPTPPLKPGELETGPIKQMYRSAIHPELFVVDKFHEGKADAMNAAINACPDPFYLLIDADTVINDKTLHALVQTSLIRPHLVACGGTIGVGNRCRFRGHILDKVLFPDKLLAGTQAVEYLRSFLYGRLGMNHIGGNLILSGAFGFFDRDVVAQAGGYMFNIGDDVDIVVRIHRLMREKKKPYQVHFIPDLVAWTEVPEDWASLSRQRERWHRGVLNVVWANKHVLFNPKYGRFGFFTFPLLVLVETISPVIETSGYFVVLICMFFGIVNWPFAFWYLFLAILFPIVLTSVCIMMELSSFRNYKTEGVGLKMLYYAVVEQLGVRQTLMIFRFLSFFKWFKKEEGWVENKRTGIRNE